MITKNDPDGNGKRGGIITNPNETLFIALPLKKQSWIFLGITVLLDFNIPFRHSLNAWIMIPHMLLLQQLLGAIIQILHPQV